MQNHRYYAVINSKNEKKIFDNSKDYVAYKYRNRATINCKGFDDLQAAQNWLNTHSYMPYGNENNQELSWAHEAPVFTEPFVPGIPAHADIYVGACRDRNTGCGAYGIIITSPQYPNTHQVAHVISADQVQHGVSDALVGIARAARIAFDNGFKTVNVHTTSRHAVKWLNGEWQAKCEAAMDYLTVMDDLIQNKNMTITPILVMAKDTNAPREQFAALSLAQYVLQKT